MPPESAAWSTLRRAFEQAGLPFRSSLQARNAKTIAALVRSDFGVAFATELLSLKMPWSGVKLREVNDPNLQRRVGIITTKGRAMQPAVKAFRTTLRDTAGAVGRPPRWASA